MKSLAIILILGIGLGLQAANPEPPAEPSDICPRIFALNGPATQIGNNVRVGRVLRAVGTLGQLMIYTEDELRQRFGLNGHDLKQLNGMLNEAGYRLPQLPIEIDILKLGVNAKAVLGRMGITRVRVLNQTSEDALRLAARQDEQKVIGEIRRKLEKLGLSFDPRGVNTGVDDLELSVRSRRRLEEVGIVTLGDILLLTRAQLKESCRSEMTTAEIQARVETLGFRLARPQ